MVAVGYNDSGQCDVSNWTDIVEIAAGIGHTVGLQADHTVIAVGDNSYGQCDVGNWTDIIQVAAGYGHTVGRKADGTVVAVGESAWGQCNVSGWTDITQVAAGSYHTVGRKSDGTVVAAGLEIELAKWNLGVVKYALTISGTSGGSITTPNKKESTYNAGMVVRVVAKPEKGYRFVNWTGDVDTIANVDAATTIITMRGNYSITANFEAWANWALIGGIIAAVVAVGLVIFFVRRRRVAQTKER
jgi:alpha-tubulin suppressor-like RCC1 family protein